MSAAVSAAVEATAGPAVKTGATTVSASTMEVAATITTAAAEAVAAVEVPTAIASSIEAASVTAVTVGAVSATAVIAAAIAVSATVVAATVVATPVIAVVPGAGADEDATDEPVRPVVSVGSTVVGGIIVVAIGADWRGAVIDRSAYANPEGDALGVGVGGGEKTNTETNCE